MRMSLMRQCLKEIEKARNHIHFEFYTIRDDAIGMRFQEALDSESERRCKGQGHL